MLGVSLLSPCCLLELDTGWYLMGLKMRVTMLQNGINGRTGLDLDEKRYDQLGIIVTVFWGEGRLIIMQQQPCLLKEKVAGNEATRQCID